MALGDLMASRFSYSSLSVSSHLTNHVDEFQEKEDTYSVSQVAMDPNEASSSAVATSMAYLPQTVVLCEPRHDTFEACVPAGPSEGGLVSKWRLKVRMKTGCVALVVCLNINVDPPDVIKISPCARMECWIDPFSMASSKALEAIGKALHAQYERWQPRARYKLQLDPTVEEIKKLCINCRKNARTERVLFHYNGHGVPKPTISGEIWFFNKSYTQYIPLPISELDSWLKTPSIYVFDCSAAGLIVNAFKERQEWSSSGPSSSSSSRDCILLAACEAHENLPQSAEFPADVFTSCLTTPIKMALRWFCSRSLLRHSLDRSLIDQIPGRQNDRKTLLGELNWIFTAVTDTIAWNVLPHDLFQRLFRQDLLVASLFRNFLLAERIMRSTNCSPVSYPPLPSTHQHHMWDAWDMAAEMCLSKLPSLISDPNAECQSSLFFTEQLKAFEVWLDHGSEHKKPPEQLPIVLQVLLSQSHRFRALILLGRFLDMGPWAVDLALSVGIFPYVLKLLQTTTTELRNILVFIWTKILALDKSCQVDLVKDGGHAYFIRFLDSLEAFPEQRAMAAFVLTVIVDGHRHGQEVCLQEHLIHVILRRLQLANPNESQSEPLLLQWLCLCLGKLCEDFPEAQTIGLQSDAPAMYTSLLSEPQPEVRAAAVFGLGTLLDVSNTRARDGIRDDDDDEEDEKIKAELTIIKSLLGVVADGSPLVRAELVVALSRFAFGHSKHLKSVAASLWKPQTGSVLGNARSLQANPLLTAGSETSSAYRDRRVSNSSPLGSSVIRHSSPLSDDSSNHSDPGIPLIDNLSNGLIDFARSSSNDTSVYSQCVVAMFALAKDPSPRIASLGQRSLSMIGIEQVIAKPLRFGNLGIQQGESPSPSPILAGLARSSSWFDMNAGHLPLTFRTPPVSPPRQNFLTGIRRVCSLEFRPHQLNSPDSGSADPVLGSSGASSGSDRSLLPQSTIYKWSCGHFSRPLLTGSDDDEEILFRREQKEKYALDCIAKCQHNNVTKLSAQIASWDTKFEMGTRKTLLLPFSPVVVATDQNERIRVWNYEEATTLNSFENHEFSDKGISNLCLANEFDENLLLVASSDGNIRIWKDFTVKGGQKLVTAFSSIPSYKPSAGSANAIVDWQQQSGYLFASHDTSPIMVWDLYKEKLVKSVPSSSDSCITALTTSQVHEQQFAAGFEDGSVKLYDIRTSEMPVWSSKPHVQRVQRVVGIGFQPGLDGSKIVSASQAGDIRFLDIRRPKDDILRLTIDAYRGSLAALAIHRHAPVIASGSAKQIIKVFSLDGEQLSMIKYHPTFIAQRIGSVSCLAFHPYRALLAVGASDSLVTIYSDESSQAW